jgi:hypothetical protein
MQSTQNPLNCPACKQGLTAQVFLGACRKYWTALQVVHFACPLCEGVTEAQLRPGMILLGYSYAAGSPHFCAMIEVPVDELQVEAGLNEVTARLGAQSWTIRSA